MKKPRKISSTKHMCISVEGVLNQYKKKKITFCSNDDGSPMSPIKARNIFEVARYEGKRVLPMGECYRFDYQTGCKGHIKSLMPTDEVMVGIQCQWNEYIASNQTKTPI
jgi:hypothetical protein